MKKWMPYILTLLLAAAVVLRFWVYFRDHQLSYYLKGTFLSGERYLTVFEDGYYCDYRQGELLEEGTCTRREPGIFTFVPDGGQGTFWELLALGNGSLYRTMDGRIVEYRRLTEKPQLFNARSSRIGGPGEPAREPPAG